MLKPEHFSYKCPLKLSDLDQTDGGHFCAKCSKDIYDLTDCSLEEIVQLQRRKGSICGFVRAVGVTSMVGLAACSDENSANDAQPDVDAKPGIQQSEIMGEICVPEKEISRPEPAKPEKTPEENDSTVSAGGKTPEKPAKPQVIEAEVLEIHRPMVLGKICPENELLPDQPEALDPHREGSPG